jgi:hypothetical protein
LPGAGLGVLGQPSLLSRDVLAARMQDAVAVADGDLGRFGGPRQADDRGPGRARAGDHDPDVMQGFPGMRRPL